jgi:hypothetical protein
VRRVRPKLPATMFAGGDEAHVMEEGGAIMSFHGLGNIERKLPRMGSEGRVVIGTNKVYHSRPDRRSPSETSRPLGSEAAGRRATVP